MLGIGIISNVIIINIVLIIYFETNNSIVFINNTQ